MKLVASVLALASPLAVAQAPGTVVAPLPEVDVKPVAGFEVVSRLAGPQHARTPA